MKTVSVTELRTHCYRLLDEVFQTRQPLGVTKRGKLIGIISPPPLPDSPEEFGR